MENDELYTEKARRRSRRHRFSSPRLLDLGDPIAWPRTVRLDARDFLCTPPLDVSSSFPFSPAIIRSVRRRFLIIGDFTSRRGTDGCTSAGSSLSSTSRGSCTARHASQMSPTFLCLFLFFLRKCLSETVCILMAFAKIIY